MARCVAARTTAPSRGVAQPGRTTRARRGMCPSPSPLCSCDCAASTATPPEACPLNSDPDPPHLCRQDWNTVSFSSKPGGNRPASARGGGGTTPRASSGPGPSMAKNGMTMQQLEDNSEDLKRECTGGRFEHAGSLRPHEPRPAPSSPTN